MELNASGFRATVVSHPGRVRDANQDQMVVSTLIGGGNFVKLSQFSFAEPELVAVIDGMGGHAGGEVAARTAAAVLASCWDPPEGPDQLERLIAGANDAIYDLMEHQPGLRGMGATVVAAVPTERGWLVGHVGDARAYAATDGVAVRLTEDDRAPSGDLSQALGGLAERSGVVVHLACHEYGSYQRLLL